MRKHLPLLTLLAFASLQAPAALAWNTLNGQAPIVIGHRGASGYLPEHTLEAYALAIQQGAHFIEPDLVMTKDGELIARHEPMLARVNLDASGNIVYVNGAPQINRTVTTTNVWMLPQYANRLTVKTLDGQKVGGWFAEDFTAAEIRADIRAQERLRDLRVANNTHNDLYVIPTLQEVIDLAKAHNVGVYPELKHSSYMAGIFGARVFEDKLVATLHANYPNSASAPVYIQSFEVGNLQYLNTRTDIRLVQLLNASGRPYDFVLSGDPRTYLDLARPDANGLHFIKTYADGLGVNSNLIIPVTGGVMGSPTGLIAAAHGLGLEVHGWTFRAENQFLPTAFDSSTDPRELGDMVGYTVLYLKQGMDGFFTDHPDLGVAAVAAVPEPGTYALMLAGLGLIGLLARHRRSG
jgi:glycerophosphoryl diester phosphodiesterase